jgi:hypothetical protein
MLDAAGDRVAVHRPHLVRFAVDHERLHALEHDPELFVLVAVQWDGRARLELDHVEHRALTEERAAGNAGGELERLDVREVDELWSHRPIVRFG